MALYSGDGRPAELPGIGRIQSLWALIGSRDTFGGRSMGSMTVRGCDDRHIYDVYFLPHFKASLGTSTWNETRLSHSLTSKAD
jgi:hypothetical protein